MDKINMTNSVSTRRSLCRLCDCQNLTLVLPIKATPIADAFVTADKLNIVQPLIPLDLYQCHACGHVQNIDVVNPNLLFRDYIFQTSSSAGLVNHFNQYANDVVDQFDIKSDSLVVEIGSNDGTLLNFFKFKNMRVIGIDPALEIAKQATSNGIPTIPDFFTTPLANDIKSQHGLAKLIVANNVYDRCY
jgi:hypothetical protein